MQGFNLILFILHFLLIILLLPEFSRRLYMMVQEGFNSFSKSSLRFFSEELKHSSSCIPKCNSFYLIFWGGVMSLLIISLRVSWSKSFSRVTYLNPSFSLRSRHLFNQSTSSLELSCVMFHLKPSLRIVAFMVLINDPSSSFILPVK